MPSEIENPVDWQKYVIDDSGVEEQENKIRFYDQNANHYESGMAAIGYAGPKQMADLIHHYYKDNQDANLLAVAAGTGPEMVELQKLGSYTNITALDAAQEMLNILKERKLCNKIICQLFVENSALPADFYDGVFCLGGFVPGHLQCDALAEMCRVVRPGGLVIVLCRDKYLLESSDYGNGKFRKAIQKLVDDGKWEEIENCLVPEYCTGLSGAKFVYRKLAKSNQ